MMLVITMRIRHTLFPLLKKMFEKNVVLIVFFVMLRKMYVRPYFLYV